MFRIRDQQFMALSEAMLAGANRRLAEYIRKRFPSKFVATPETELVSLAARVRATARGYGIEREDDIATFMDLTAMYGDKFHRDPWAASVLDNDAAPGQGKMASLRYRVESTGVEL